MTIRPIAAGDLDNVIHLAASIAEAPQWSRPAWETYLSESESSPPRRILVAESGGELTGFIAGQIIAGICELESIAVSRAHRRSGIGRALLATFKEWSSSARASKIQLEVRAGNASALAFYEKAGFRPDGLRLGYYQDPEEDALLMTLPLSPQPLG